MPVRVGTWLSDRYGLDLPVATASMAGVADGRFAAAAGQAGVLGTIGVGSGQSGDWIVEQAQLAASAMR
ncbi:MAG: nitronate monooxygenase, partial [Propionibacteriales bacterium]|nr:nitronate monooxygenase [Propionibacteriales bacterium]